MAIVKFRGSHLQDRRHDYGGGFGNAGDPGYATGGSTGPGTGVPVVQRGAGPKMAKDDLADSLFSALGFQDSADKKNARRLLESNQLRWDELEQIIPDLYGEMYLNPYKDIQYYGGEQKPLDLSSALDELSMLYEKDSRSAVADMDLAGRDAQTESLDYWRQLLANDGRDAVSDAYYEGKRADAEQAARAQREAALQAAEQRGQATGGAGLMAEMAAARDVGRNANRAGLQATALMQQRRDGAAANLGSGGSTLYGQDLTRAGKEDDWKKVLNDTWERLGVNRSNIVGQEATANWNRNNSTDDANVTLRNSAIMRNADLPRWAWDAYTTTTAGKTGANVTTANHYTQNPQANPWDAVGGMLEKGAHIFAASQGMPSALGSLGGDDEEKNRR